MSTTQTEQHQHEWTHTDHDGIRAWACTGCTETSATCGTCGRASGTSLLLCPRCEKHAARVLDDIDHALGLWQPDPRSPMKSPGHMRLVPAGGDVERDAGPDAIMGALWGWAARWTEYAGADGSWVTDYLRGHHIWAAHNPDVSDWEGYLRDTKRLRAEARRIAGLLPQRVAEPCPMCGGDVVQDWADERWNPLRGGLSDTVRCTGCAMSWGDRSHWGESLTEHIGGIPERHPDALVTLEQARQIWPDVPSGTWRQWARRWREEGEDAVERVRYWWEVRCAYLAGPDSWPAWAGPDWQGPGEPPSLAGWMPERGELDGAATYRVGDLQALVVRRVAEGRQGRAASERIGA